jgi:hypothetical protein
MPETTDRRAMLREAFDRSTAGDEEEVETPAAEETPEEPVEAPAAAEETPAEHEGETEEQKAARERDEKGRFAAAPKEKEEKAPKAPKAAAAPKAKPGTAPEPKPAAPAVPAQAAAPAPKGPETKPPQSWTPAEREQWGKLTPEAQRAVLRTEGETRRVLQENAGLRREYGEAQKFRSEIDNGLRPFEGIFRSQGMDPLSGAMSVVRTYAALHYGAPQQKADILADLIVRFGDVDSVNAAMERRGAGVPAAPQPQYRQPQAQQPVDYRAAIREELAGLTQQAVSSRADRDLEAFLATSPEFAQDPQVWEDMQVVLDAAAKGGRNVTYQQAYDRALKMNEEIQGVLQQRAQAAAMAQPSATAPTARARTAAATVRSKPAPAVTQAVDPKDRRAMLQKAMENSSR